MDPCGSYVSHICGVIVFEFPTVTTRSQMMILFLFLLLSLIGSGWTVLFDKPTKVDLSRAYQLIENLPKGDPWLKNPEGSTLAWGESYTLGALMDLYETTHDRHLLNLLAQRGLQLIAHRDDRRGVTDGSGQSRPAWSVGSKYVVAQGEIKDRNGKTILLVRSTPSAYNNLTEVEILPMLENRYAIRVSNEHHQRFEFFENLSLDQNDERYLPTVVNDPMAPYSTRRGNYTGPSNLIRIEFAGQGFIPAQKIRLEPIPLAFAGYLGVIYHPLIRFAEIVKNDRELTEWVSVANQFIQAAEESYEDVGKRLWRETPGIDEGFYLMCEKGESMPADNVGQPFNYLARHVCVQLALYRLTGKTEYLNRSRKMVNLFKNRLILDIEKDLYVWNYWYEPMTTVGWKPEDEISFNVKYYPGKARIEDVSHGGHDIAMVVEAFKMGVGFDSTDVRRFANTFLNNVLSPDRRDIARLVDGTGTYPAYFRSVYQWFALGEIYPEVIHAGKEIYENRPEESLPFTARLLKYSGRR